MPTEIKLLGEVFMSLNIPLNILSVSVNVRQMKKDQVEFLK